MIILQKVLLTLNGTEHVKKIFSFIFFPSQSGPECIMRVNHIRLITVCQCIRESEELINDDDDDVFAVENQKREAELSRTRSNSSM